MDKCLIVLTGQGDEEYCLVDKNVWDWIHDNNDITFPDFLKDEWRSIQSKWYVNKQQMEDEIIEIEKKMQYGSNDKALTIMGCFNYSTSVMDLNKYCKKHDIDIVSEYSGYIY